MMKINKKGFTLIELLIVIAIIGILASIVLVSLSSARQRARMAEFKATVSSLNAAMIVDCDAVGTGPTSVTWPTANTTSNGTIANAADACSNGEIATGSDTPTISSTASVTGTACTATLQTTGVLFADTGC